MTDSMSGTPQQLVPLGLRQIAELLFEEGLLAKQAYENLQVQARYRDLGDKHPLTLIADQRLKSALPPQRLLSEDFLSEWLAHKLGLPYRRIDPLKVDMAAVTQVVSYAYAERHKLLPVEVGPDYVVMATAQPDATGWLNELAHILRKDVRLVMTSPSDIQSYLVEFYTVSHSVQGASADDSAHPQFINGQQMLELGKAGSLDANDQHVVRIVDWLLQYAFDQRASDIHLEPRQEKGNIRFRIDGMLHTVYQLPSAVMAAVLSRLKILGRMDLAEKRRPLDGRLKTKSPDGNEVELRLATLPTAFGEKMVLRIFDPDVLVKNFTDLGFNRHEEKQWRGMLKQPNGIILVTGPTGSGKTTTLYSSLKYLAKPEVNICTIEDPIEMVVPDFNQMQVQHNIDLNFADGVRALLRQDPDIIMVGEIRDLETAEMAIQAALTGHLVISTLHTNDAVSAVTRLLDLGVPHYMITATLLGVVGQRLVRTLCPHCKQPVAPDAAMWTSLSRPWKAALPEQVYGPVGCLECRQTGYVGRVGIYEMLVMSGAIKRLINANDCDMAAVRRQARQDEMRPMRISGIQKVVSGQTTLDEVFRVAPLHQDD
ncbi:type II secretion system protein E [Candidatus Tenderia electrophaga]|uniref:Type II secretion system protein E n=1 Tax=Candidatus Tenderia electrophaga TaxID=1748243 RepID=A0A0S2T965_9GAMM|nr:type II secretion system protein E [Candidatus Tenderia electrophaga]